MGHETSHDLVRRVNDVLQQVLATVKSMAQRDCAVELGLSRTELKEAGRVITTILTSNLGLW